MPSPRQNNHSTTSTEMVKQSSVSSLSTGKKSSLWNIIGRLVNKGGLPQPAQEQECNQSTHGVSEGPRSNPVEVENPNAADSGQRWQWTREELAQMEYQESVLEAKILSLNIEFRSVASPCIVWSFLLLSDRRRDVWTRGLKLFGCGAHIHAYIQRWQHRSGFKTALGTVWNDSGQSIRARYKR